MTKKPSIAAIVPNYNHARFLRQRLDSVLRQTVAPTRIVVLDDHSSDNSEEVILDYANSRSEIMYLPSSTNSGDPFLQWNKGLAEVDEDYVWIAESDDWAEPEFLATMLQLVDDHPSAGLLYCQSDLIDEFGETVGSLDTHYSDLRYPQRWREGFFNAGPAECANYLIHRNTIPNASACLFKRSTFQDIGYASSGFRLCGDWMTYVRILARSDIAYSPKILNHYRAHNNSVRTGSQKALVEVAETYKVLNYIRENFDVDEANLEESRARTFERFHYLTSQTDLRTLQPLWRAICCEAQQFDPKFAIRLAAPFASFFHTAVVYFDENGTYSEAKKRTARIPPGQRRTLTFPGCRGQIRFDPIARPGALEIYSIAVHDQSSGDRLWAGGTDFEGVRPVGTVKTLFHSDTLLLYSFGNDPQLILEGWKNSPKFDPLRDVELRVDIATGSDLDLRSV